MEGEQSSIVGYRISQEALYRDFVRFMIEQGAMNSQSSLLKTKLTMTVRDPNDEGVTDFLEDTMTQLLASMDEEDQISLSRFFIGLYMAQKKDFTMQSYSVMGSGIGENDTEVTLLNCRQSEKIDHEQTFKLDEVDGERQL